MTSIFEAPQMDLGSREYINRTPEERRAMAVELALRTFELVNQKEAEDRAERDRRRIHMASDPYFD